jgi:hypothetical protein
MTGLTWTIPSRLPGQSSAAETAEIQDCITAHIKDSLLKVSKGCKKIDYIAPDRASLEENGPEAGEHCGDRL